MHQGQHPLHKTLLLRPLPLLLLLLLMTAPKRLGKVRGIGCK